MTTTGPDEGDPPGAPRGEGVALLEYFTSEEKTLVFLALAGLEAPLVFEVRDATGRAVTAGHLRLCLERLIVDFHGLPTGWDADAARFAHSKEALALAPAVNAAKRSKDIKERNLDNPAFAYQLTYWEEMSRALLPAGLRDQLGRCKLLCIVPHGPLHALPFAALRWSDDTYLIERFGLCQVPSASVLRYCRSQNRRRRTEPEHRPRRCLVAAVASDDDPDPREFEADGDTLAQLFLAAGEGREVVRLIGAETTEANRPASKAAVLGAMGGCDLIHLACHGLFEAGLGRPDPLDDAGLLVSDGHARPPLGGLHRLPPDERAAYFLSAREMFAVPLAADLVTLRACSSGRAQVQSGDELLGLVRALLYAGAPSLIVSLWNVNRRSSQRLLSEFYRRWLDGEAPPKWRALQQAQRGLLEDSRYAHPYHWAPFVLVGDWL
jgi:CHAT domain-containing protein